MVETGGARPLEGDGALTPVVCGDAGAPGLSGSLSCWPGRAKPGLAKGVAARSSRSSRVSVTAGQLLLRPRVSRSRAFRRFPRLNLRCRSRGITWFKKLWNGFNNMRGFSLAAILTAAIAFRDKKLAPGKSFAGGDLGGRAANFVQKSKRELIWPIARRVAIEISQLNRLNTKSLTRVIQYLGGWVRRGWLARPDAVLPALAGLPTIPALLDRTRMVRSPLRFPKHLVFAISLLGLSICGVEFGLHLHDACLLSTSSYSERNA